MEDKWIKKIETDKKICWMNTSTKELKCIFFTYLDDISPLPEGWDRRFSNSKQQFYYKYVDKFGKESFTWDPPKNSSELMFFRPSLQDMPDIVILNIITQLFKNYPLEFSDSASSLITLLPKMETIKSALDVQGTKHVFNIVDTKLWVNIIVSMGFDIFSGEFREKEYQLWDPTNINYQQMIVQECRYTSRAHDLLDLKRSANNLIHQAATVLLDKLKNAEETDEGKAFLNGELVVKKINSDFEHKDIQFLDIRDATDLTECFNGLRENVNLKYWDTSRVKNMKAMFKSSSADVTGLENWNTSSVTDMSLMFSDFQTFNCDISRWDTTNVTKMNYMFCRANNFNSDISNWNTRNVKTMRRMFSSATSFNQPIGRWITSKVTNMYGMFSNAQSFNQPIGEWITSNVIYMNDMFLDAESFNQPLNWDTSNVINMRSMFASATSFNQPIGKWITSKVTDMSYMFFEATNFNQTLDWDYNGLESLPRDMFTDSGMIFDRD